MISSVLLSGIMIIIIINELKDFLKKSTSFQKRYPCCSGQSVFIGVIKYDHFLTYSGAFDHIPWPSSVDETCSCVFT